MEAEQRQYHWKLPASQFRGQPELIIEEQRDPLLEESENRLHRSAGEFQIMTAGLLITAHVFPLPGRSIAGWRSIIELG